MEMNCEDAGINKAFKTISESFTTESRKYVQNAVYNDTLIVPYRIPYVFKPHFEAAISKVTRMQ